MGERPEATFSEVQKKLNLSFGLFAMAFRIKRHQLKKRYPELTDRELNERTHRCFEER